MTPRSIALLALLLPIACFDPDRTPPGVDTDDPSTGTGDTVCEPGTSEPCTCEDGSAGERGCAADGSGFGICACETVDTTVSTDPDSSGTPPECEVVDDCVLLAPSECQRAACVDGTCVLESLAAGTACGDDGDDDCTDPDTCDGEDACRANDAVDGSACGGCELGVCACSAGACADCDASAPTNNFITARSIEGWTMTGGWGLYREAPQNFISGPVRFDSQVFGTDGNRAEPYPSNETEESTARTSPTVLPANLEFLSWNQDEGGPNYDVKQVRVSIDGGASFVTLVDCSTDGGVTPFCVPRDERAANDWDAISLPVPPDMVGQVGVVEFYHNTVDPSTGFERGWFLDALNFATECACADDTTCEGLGSECGAAECTAMGECRLDAVVAGRACGDATENDCNAADTCDGAGYCSTDEVPTGLTDCYDCDAGPGACNSCQEAVCVDCQDLPAVNDFSFGDDSHLGWFVEDLSETGADWRIYYSAPQSQAVGSVPTPLSFAPSFGTDGNRQEPYPGLELEHSRITTTPDEVPAQITFLSWHVDEGTTDDKTIEISVDGGESWTTLVNCQQQIGTPQPFCEYRDDPRPGNEWNEIVLDTAAFAGMTGQLRFTYNTQDACCSFERGWFIDDLAFAQFCLDWAFPQVERI